MFGVFTVCSKVICLRKTLQVFSETTQVFLSRIVDHTVYNTFEAVMLLFFTSHVLYFSKSFLLATFRLEAFEFAFIFTIVISTAVVYVIYSLSDVCNDLFYPNFFD